MSIYFVCANLPHTGLTKSPVEKQNAKALIAYGSAPHVDPTSLHTNPLLV